MVLLSVTVVVLIVAATHGTAPRPAVRSTKPLPTCTDAMLTASVPSFANVAMGTYEDLVSVRATTPCLVKGYPTVTLDTTRPIVVVDGAPTVVFVHGTEEGVGDVPARTVRVTTTTSAFFVVQMSFSPDGPDARHCVYSKTMEMGTPGSKPTVAVPMAASMRANQESFGTCGYPSLSVEVSPFQQGEP